MSVLAAIAAGSAPPPYGSYQLEPEPESEPESESELAAPEPEVGDDGDVEDEDGLEADSQGEHGAGDDIEVDEMSPDEDDRALHRVLQAQPELQIDPRLFNNRDQSMVVQGTDIAFNTAQAPAGNFPVRSATVNLYSNKTDNYYRLHATFLKMFLHSIGTGHELPYLQAYPALGNLANPTLFGHSPRFHKDLLVSLHLLRTHPLHLPLLHHLNLLQRRNPNIQPGTSTTTPAAGRRCLNSRN